MYYDIDSLEKLWKIWRGGRECRRERKRIRKENLGGRLKHAAEIIVFNIWVSLVAQTVKKESAHSAGSLGWEDYFEKGMATHSGILAWRIPWTEEPGGLQSTASQLWTLLK